MIPAFPEFKVLELGDQADVEQFTFQFPPTSDFNFAGTWSWDVRNGMQISQLHGNYVVRFISYLTGAPFYTFLGTNKINDTIRQLLDLSVQENIEPVIKLIPEFCIKNIDTAAYIVEEDRDNFDYIYDLAELKDYAGSKFSKKRNHIAAFLKQHPGAQARVIDLADEKVQESILTLFHKWVQGKLTKDEDFKVHEEVVVIEKLFAAHKKFKLVGVGVYIGDELVACCINELTHAEYAVSHIAKADVNIPGASAFLMQQNAALLLPFGKTFLNTEQDLGEPKLRLAKERFRPCRFLKKYKIALA
jgi:uncharacterized protein